MQDRSDQLAQRPLRQYGIRVERYTKFRPWRNFGIYRNKFLVGCLATIKPYKRHDRTPLSFIAHPSAAVFVKAPSAMNIKENRRIGGVFCIKVVNKRFCKLQNRGILLRFACFGIRKIAYDGKHASVKPICQIMALQPRYYVTKRLLGGYQRRNRNNGSFLFADAVKNLQPRYLPRSCNARKDPYCDRKSQVRTDGNRDNRTYPSARERSEEDRHAYQRLYDNKKPQPCII